MRTGQTRLKFLKSLLPTSSQQKQAEFDNTLETMCDAYLRDKTLVRTLEDRQKMIAYLRLRIRQSLPPSIITPTSSHTNPLTFLKNSFIPKKSPLIAKAKPLAATEIKQILLVINHESDDLIFGDNRPLIIKLLHALNPDELMSCYSILAQTQQNLSELKTVYLAILSHPSVMRHAESKALVETTNFSMNLSESCFYVSPLEIPSTQMQLDATTFRLLNIQVRLHCLKKQNDFNLLNNTELLEACTHDFHQQLITKNDRGEYHTIQETSALTLIAACHQPLMRIPAISCLREINKEQLWDLYNKFQDNAEKTPETIWPLLLPTLRLALLAHPEIRLSKEKLPEMIKDVWEAFPIANPSDEDCTKIFSYYHRLVYLSTLDNWLSAKELFEARDTAKHLDETIRCFNHDMKAQSMSESELTILSYSETGLMVFCAKDDDCLRRAIPYLNQQPKVAWYLLEELGKDKGFLLQKSVFFYSQDDLVYALVKAALHQYSSASPYFITANRFLLKAIKNHFIQLIEDSSAQALFDIEAAYSFLFTDHLSPSTIEILFTKWAKANTFIPATLIDWCCAPARGSVQKPLLKAISLFESVFLRHHPLGNSDLTITPAAAFFCLTDDEKDRRRGLTGQTLRNAIHHAAEHDLEGLIRACKTWKREELDSYYNALTIEPFEPKEIGINRREESIIAFAILSHSKNQESAHFKTLTQGMQSILHRRQFEIPVLQLLESSVRKRILLDGPQDSAIDSTFLEEAHALCHDFTSADIQPTSPLLNSRLGLIAAFENSECQKSIILLFLSGQIGSSVNQGELAWYLLQHPDFPEACLKAAESNREKYIIIQDRLLAFVEQRLTANPDKTIGDVARGADTERLIQCYKKSASKPTFLEALLQGTSPCSIEAWLIMIQEDVELCGAFFENFTQTLAKTPEQNKVLILESLYSLVKLHALDKDKPAQNSARIAMIILNNPDLEKIIYNTPDKKAALLNAACLQPKAVTQWRRAPEDLMAYWKALQESTSTERSSSLEIKAALSEETLSPERKSAIAHIETIILSRSDITTHLLGDIFRSIDKRKPSAEWLRALDKRIRIAYLNHLGTWQQGKATLITAASPKEQHQLLQSKGLALSAEFTPKDIDSLHSPTGLMMAVLQDKKIGEAAIKQMIKKQSFARWHLLEELGTNKGFLQHNAHIKEQHETRLNELIKKLVYEYESLNGFYQLNEHNSLIEAHLNTYIKDFLKTATPDALFSLKKYYPTTIILCLEKTPDLFFETVAKNQIFSIKEMEDYFKQHSQTASIKPSSINTVTTTVAMVLDFASAVSPIAHLALAGMKPFIKANTLTALPSFVCHIPEEGFDENNITALNALYQRYQTASLEETTDYGKHPMIRALLKNKTSGATRACAHLVFNNAELFTSFSKKYAGHEPKAPWLIEKLKIMQKGASGGAIIAVVSELRQVVSGTNRAQTFLAGFTGIMFGYVSGFGAWGALGGATIGILAPIMIGAAVGAVTALIVAHAGGKLKAAASRIANYFEYFFGQSLPIEKSDFAILAMGLSGEKEDLQWAALLKHPLSEEHLAKMLLFFGENGHHIEDISDDILSSNMKAKLIAVKDHYYYNTYLKTTHVAWYWMLQITSTATFGIFCTPPWWLSYGKEKASSEDFCTLPNKALQGRFSVTTESSPLQPSGPAISSTHGTAVIGSLQWLNSNQRNDAPHKCSTGRCSP